MQKVCEAYSVLRRISALKCGMDSGEVMEAVARLREDDKQEFWIKTAIADLLHLRAHIDALLEIADEDGLTLSPEEVEALREASR